jgi:hypothetical protein
MAVGDYETGGVTGNLEDQFRQYLEGQLLRGGSDATQGFAGLNPFARRQAMARMAPATTEFQLFGTGDAFGTFLGDRPTAGRTREGINTQVQNLRKLLAAKQGGYGDSGFEGAQAQALRGYFGESDEAQMNAALLGASRGVNPYFRGAMRTGAEEGYKAYRAGKPGTSWLDYADAVGLLT